MSASLDKANEKRSTQAAIDNQPFLRSYIEYETVCPYCEVKLRMDRWPRYKCACSEWVCDFGGKYKRQEAKGGKS